MMIKRSLHEISETCGLCRHNSIPHRPEKRCHSSWPQEVFASPTGYPGHITWMMRAVHGRRIRAEINTCFASFSYSVLVALVSLFNGQCEPDGGEGVRRSSLFQSTIAFGLIADSRCGPFSLCYFQCHADEIPPQLAHVFGCPLTVYICCQWTQKVTWRACVHTHEGMCACVHLCVNGCVCVCVRVHACVPCHAFLAVTSHDMSGKSRCESSGCVPD